MALTPIQESFAELIQWINEDSKLHEVLTIFGHCLKNHNFLVKYINPEGIETLYTLPKSLWVCRIHKIVDDDLVLYTSNNRDEYLNHDTMLFWFIDMPLSSAASNFFKTGYMDYYAPKYLENEYSGHISLKEPEYLGPRTFYVKDGWVCTEDHDENDRGLVIPEEMEALDKLHEYFDEGRYSFEFMVVDTARLSALLVHLADKDNFGYRNEQDVLAR